MKVLVILALVAGTSALAPLQPQPRSKHTAPLNYQSAVTPAEICSKQSNLPGNTLFPGTSSDMKVEVVEPGLVLIRNLLSDDRCRQIAEKAFQLGEEGEDGGGLAGCGGLV